jgi:uncharacterized protein YlxW (UPF0749 family)
VKGLQNEVNSFKEEKNYLRPQLEKVNKKIDQEGIQNEQEEATKEK